MRQGVAFTGIGLVIRSGGSLAAGRLLRSHLFATSPADPVMITSAASILGLRAPCRHAGAGPPREPDDPVRALRDESV